jgi:DNA primase large subunit
MAVEDLRKSDMMAHLLEALDAGEDIGHYGRLVFAMIARHFMSEEEVIEYLQKDTDFSEGEAKALYQQVQGKDYNPPKRDRILEWQSKQDFPICPNSDDPDACNVYRDLTFPEHVYEHISEYYEQKA